MSGSTIRSEIPFDHTFGPKAHKDPVLESTRDPVTSLVSKEDGKPFEAKTPKEIAMVAATHKFFQTLARHQAYRGYDLTWTPQEHYAEQQSFLTNRQLVGRLKNKKLQISEIRDLFSNLMALQLFLRQCQCRSAVTRLNTRTVVALDGIFALAELMEKAIGKGPTDWTELKTCFSTVTYEEVPHMNYIPSISWFKPEGCLGVGGFGSVYRCRFADGSVIALKLVARNRISKLDHVLSGKIVGSVVSYPCILSTYAFFTTDQCHAYVTEFLEGVDLAKVIKQSKGLDVALLKVVSAQLCLAVNFLHVRGVIHRDIKPSNMILTPGSRLKVFDFDTCKFCLGNFDLSEDFSLYNRISSREFRDNRMPGTTVFTAPEVLSGRAYGRALDWWSVGISMMQMFTNRFPFKGKTKSKIRRAICKFKSLDWLPEENPPADLKSIISGFLTVKPSKRLGSQGLKSIQSVEFFDCFDWEGWRSGKASMKCEILAKLLEEKEKLFKGIEERAKERIVRLEDQTMIQPQEPLLTWTSPSFRASLQLASQKHSDPLQPGNSPKLVKPMKDLWLRIYSIPSYRRLEWKRLAHDDQRTGVKLLPTSGRVSPGQIVSVWGPVDSATDTLAQILAGKIEDYAGCVETSPADLTYVEDITQANFSFPENETIRETIEFYFRTILYESPIPASEINIEVGNLMREFGLEQLQYSYCSTLDRSERQLLYVISMLLKPRSIVVLQNPNRHLSGLHCVLIAQRLRLLARTGHSILLMSSFVSAAFLNISDHLHLIHSSGQSFYAGSLKGLENYLQVQGVVGIVHRYSYEDLIYGTFSLEDKDFKQIMPRLQDPPAASSMYSEDLSVHEFQPPRAFWPLLSRTLRILTRHELLLRTKLLLLVSFAAMCKLVRVPDQSRENSRMIVDLLLIYAAGINLLFSTLESRKVDRVLCQDGRGPLKGVCTRTSIIGIRLLILVVSECSLNLLLWFLFASWVGFPRMEDLPSMVPMATMCSLFYAFVGSISGLSETRQKLSSLIHAMILLFTLSAMVILNPTDETRSIFKSFNPVFVTKVMILNASPNPAKRSTGRSGGNRSEFWGDFGKLSLCTLLMLVIYVIRFEEGLRGRRRRLLRFL
ncbi:uncharacterized protein LOC114828095 [Galendromus occidentalis]|uniref:Serine/threonine-protein kinase greatwall n=1 Tax=Galendromus occidentalis TaxID=34638 RepID=A0AAJ7WH69_9ACAR|nr:uncharacterized protein LOC114828095 [Galendromus occidentalis]